MRVLPVELFLEVHGLGLQVTNYNGVAQMRHGGAAARSGLCVGDVIIAVDGDLIGSAHLSDVLTRGKVQSSFLVLRCDTSPPPLSVQLPPPPPSVEPARSSERPAPSVEPPPSSRRRGGKKRARGGKYHQGSVARAKAERASRKGEDMSLPWYLNSSEASNPSRHHTFMPSAITPSRHRAIMPSRYRAIMPSCHHTIYLHFNLHVITPAHHHTITPSHHHVITASRHGVIAPRLQPATKTRDVDPQPFTPSHHHTIAPLRNYAISPSRHRAKPLHHHTTPSRHHTVIPPSQSVSVAVAVAGRGRWSRSLVAVAGCGRWPQSRSLVAGRRR